MCDDIELGSGIAIGGVAGDHGNINIRIGTIGFTTNGGTAIGCYGTTATVVGMISAIRKVTAGITDTVGLNCGIGMISLFIGELESDIETVGNGIIYWSTPAQRGDLQSHVDDKNNPHEVNYTQTGLVAEMLIPTGGNVDQVLSKVSTTDRDVYWRSINDGMTWTISDVDIDPAVSNHGYLMSVADAPRTVNLPASPSSGEIVGVGTWAGDASLNPITIGANGRLIMGKAEDLIIDIDNGSVILVYTEAAIGWRIIGGAW